nr:zinc finger, CCHC-type [Tanacetum cinerariifolium]
MDVAIMKHMDSNFVKLKKFEGVYFRRWQAKLYFLLSSMSVVYVLTTLIPGDGGDDATNVKSSKELWDSLEAKYRADDASSKKLIHTLQHKKDELALVELGSHLRIEESLRVQDNDKKKGQQCCWSTVIGRGCVDLKFSSGKIVSLLNVLYVPNAFRFYVIEPNDSVSVNSIIESKDAIFDENRFSSVPRLSLRIPNGTKDIGCSVVPKEVTKEDEVSDQHSYCFNVEDDPKIFDEPMKSQDVAFWKEAINDEMDSIMGNNTWMLANLPPGCKPLGCKWIFKRKLKVDKTIEKFKAMLVIQGFKQKLGINYFDTYALVARISTIRLLIAMASIHILIIHQMDVKISFLNGELNEEVYTNQPQGFIMSENENKVYLLGGGAISWASKKQTCITGSTMESEFVALAAVSKEAECKGSATLAKAYSQMYNRKSRHLGVKHNMIRDLIMNEVISIEFVRSQQNLASNLINGLPKDLVIKSAEEMGLKSN